MFVVGISNVFFWCGSGLGIVLGGDWWFLLEDCVFLELVLSVCGLCIGYGLICVVLDEYLCFLDVRLDEVD